MRFKSSERLHADCQNPNYVEGKFNAGLTAAKRRTIQSTQKSTHSRYGMCRACNALCRPCSTAVADATCHVAATLQQQCTCHLRTCVAVQNKADTICKKTVTRALMQQLHNLLTQARAPLKLHPLLQPTWMPGCRTCITKVYLRQAASIPHAGSMPCTTSSTARYHLSSELTTLRTLSFFRST